jgi:predicted  nucleic acid-binding Zn-ribbon protein
MSLNSTVSNGDVSDFFRDIPVDQMPPVIGSGLALSDSAVELPDSEAEPGDAEDDTRRAPPNSAPLMAPPRPDMPRSTHDRSQSFSFGQTVFMSMGRSFSSSSEPAASKDAPPRAPGQFGIQPVFSRLRSQSETMLTRVPSEVSSNASADSLARAQNTSHYVSALGPRSPSFSSQDGSIAEASSGSIAVWTKPDPDPFAADAGTYYTAETRIAQTPPELDAMSQASAYFPGALSISGSRGPLASSESLSRTSSRDDSVLLALREQLAVQEQLARQTELDLAARDELVVALQERLGAANAEVDARRGAIRGWRKKVAELERACRHLEHQADHSARDSMDRSVLEEASSEALRMLHRRIDALETERRDAARDAAALREQLAKREADLAEHEEQNRLLRDGALSAQEPVSAENGGARGDEEKAPLAMDLQRLEQERELLEQEAQTLRDSVKELQDAAQRRARELEDLQTELEAQWKNTENASTAYDKLKAEKAAVEKDCGVLQENVVALEGRISSMETDWTDAENGRADLTGQLEEALAAREEVEHERDDVSDILEHLRSCLTSYSSLRNFRQSKLRSKS